MRVTLPLDPSLLVLSRLVLPTQHFFTSLRCCLFFEPFFSCEMSASPLTSFVLHFTPFPFHIFLLVLGVSTSSSSFLLFYRVCPFSRSCVLKRRRWDGRRAQQLWARPHRFPQDPPLLVLLSGSSQPSNRRCQTLSMSSHSQRYLILLPSETTVALPEVRRRVPSGMSLLTSRSGLGSDVRAAQADRGRYFENDTYVLLSCGGSGRRFHRRQA